MYTFRAEEKVQFGACICEDEQWSQYVMKKSMKLNHINHNYNFLKRRCGFSEDNMTYQQNAYMTSAFPMTPKAPMTATKKAMM